MDKMTLNINTPSYESNAAISFSNSEKNNKTNLPEKVDHIQTDKIAISKEGKEKQLEEAATATLQTIMDAGETEDSASIEESPIEAMITELQEKIAELTKEITQLSASGDEASQEKAKALGVRLAGLYSQLLELVSQKFESETKSA